MGTAAIIYNRRRAPITAGQRPVPMMKPARLPLAERIVLSRPVAPSYYSTEMEEHMSGQAAAESVDGANGVRTVQSRSSTPLRSSTWARDVRVEITRIEHRLRIALVSHHSPYEREIGEAIRAHLKEAEDVISRRRWIAALFSPIDWYRGTSIEQAYRSLHAARVFLVQLVAEEDLDALVPGVLARVQSCLPATDPQRIELEKLPNADPKTKRAKLVRALERGFAASDEAHANIRRFRNVVLCSAVLIALVTFLLVHQVGQHPTAVPLCFQPDITAAQAASLPVNQQAGGSRTVCPSGEQAVGGTPRSPSEFDIWIVAGLGLLGGGLSSAVSVRKMAHTVAPYDVPLALALLKLPTGALTAVAGIILLGGGFVPGLSELDTQRQILAYSLIFGYAQQLATRYLDDRATTLLAAVPSKHTPLVQTRSLPSTTTDPQQQAESGTPGTPSNSIGSLGDANMQISTNGSATAK
jgi:hypothetical protein